MALTPITDAAIDSAKIGSIVGDTMTGTAQQNKERFDELPLLVANKLNDVIKQLNGTTSGASIDISGDITADGDLAVDGNISGAKITASNLPPTIGRAEVINSGIKIVNKKVSDSSLYTINLTFAGFVQQKTQGDDFTDLTFRRAAYGDSTDDTVSLESNANAVSTGVSFELPAYGTYLLIASVQFASSTAGRRMAQWYDSTNSSVLNESTNSAAPVDGAITRLQTVAVVTTTATTTYVVRAQQNTGSALSTHVYAQYIVL